MRQLPPDNPPNTPTQLTQRQLFVARAHFDLLRAISEGAGHSVGSTGGVRPLLDAGLVGFPAHDGTLPDEAFPVEVTDHGKTAIVLVRRECEGNPAHDHRIPGNRNRELAKAKRRG